MAAQTFTAATASRSLPISGNPGAGGGVLHCAIGTIVIPETPEVGDIYEMCWLPKGAIPVGGYLSTADADTGTETFDMDVGIAANGVDAADPDYFTNSGLLSGDNILPDFIFTNAANVRMFTRPFPVVQLGAKTLVQCQVIAVAATAALVTVCVTVYFVIPNNVN